ncbi:MHYT domain-containing protein [Variovorax terrae]|uniref:Histidine kinase n=1 Tax=Variovorax terrae TaxID=2923278 RepID=A0A9X2ALG8_9BURK|nr:MHYT domain-containing protein [Variovorax terrae]MCJ0761645.1 histidine kinase [Variovorax terrae]
MNPIVGQVLVPQYQIGAVVLSYIMAVLGSLAALQCAKHMFTPQGTLDKGMATAAAVALGGIGIWSMHFIGMLAYRTGVPVAYDLIPTAVSLVAAIVISGAALYLTGRGGRFGVPGWVAGSILAGLGVCVMHYLGMYAMNLRASMSWDVERIGLSVAIAVVAAAAALWLAFNLTTLRHRIMAAFVMGVAVCAMHYTGMSAVTLVCTAEAPASAWKIGGRDLDLMVFVTAAAVLLYIYWVVSGRAIRQRGKQTAA